MTDSDTSLVNKEDAFIAANKFGLGLRPGELETVSQNPRAWLKNQLETIDRLPSVFANLPPSSELIRQDGETQQQRRVMSQRNGSQENIRALNQQMRREKARTQQDQISQRLQAAITSEFPFAERLVRFWSNHFTIAVSGGPKAILRTIAVPYENEAIRTNLTADFQTLLMAVEQHPAMLIYLDNAASIGPSSTIGKRRDRGLNENLAREILELHTLGVNGGYTQTDVTNLAKIITGWTVIRGQGDRNRRRLPGASGSYQFIARMHEPGSHVLVGKSYRSSGQRQGEQALASLANHPSTARHIATKLARHFVADEPPESAIAKIEHVFLETKGSLPAIHETLVDLDEAWQTDHRKLKTPEELVVSTARALGLGSNTNIPQRLPVMLNGTLASLNQMPFTAPSPAGWPDDADHWGSPDAILKRIEWANEMAAQNQSFSDPLLLYRQVIAPDELLEQAISRAESGTQGLTLLLASPGFQWR